VSKASDFMSDVVNARIRILSKTSLPGARAVSAQELSTVRHDCERVSTEAVVRSANFREGGLMLDLIAGTVQFKAYIPEITSMPADLVDAHIRIRGTCGGFYNSRNQFIAFEVLVPNLSDVTVISTPPSYAMLPVNPLRTILHPAANRQLVHRVFSATHFCVTCPSRARFSQSSQSRSSWLIAIRSIPPAWRLSRGTFYFAQLGTSHIAATCR
jgi:hypothetical protein